MGKKKIKREIDIPPGSIVRVKETGNIVEVLYASRRSKGGYIVKLNKDQYIDKRTGEIREFAHTDNRADGIESIEKSMVKLRDLLNTNVVIPDNCRWLTLTYKSNMQDPDRLRYDFGNYNKRCRKKFGPYEYIAVAEPQGRGAWHLHVVLIFSHHAPFMENNVVAKLWGKGFVSIKKLDNIDNVGAYLTAYLGDIAIEEYQALNPNAKHFGEIKVAEVKADDGSTVPKRYIKGGRLVLYPPGFHLFRYSQGILKPTIRYDSYQNVKTALGDAAMTYKQTSELIDDDSGFSCLFSREIYNKERKKKEESTND